MKRLTNLIVLCVGLLVAASAFAQTAVVQSLANVTNKGATYHAAATYELVANPSDFLVIAGSATKTVYVKSVKATCTLTTAAQATLYMYKRTTATTVVSATALSAVPADSSDSAATAAVYTYVSGTAADPTPGTGVVIDIQKMSLLAPGTAAGGATVYSRDFGVGMDRYLTLRGVAQNLTLSFADAAVTGALCAVSVSWIER